MKGNFLAVDTSNGYLTILARKDGRVHTLYEPDCAAQHSVRLMPAAEEALAALSLPPADCAFFCAVTGPGSFTGIRIGISAVKGLCAATGAPALGVKAYAVTMGRKAAARYTPVRLKKCVDTLHSVQYDMLTGRIGKDSALHTAVLTLLTI